MDSEIEFKKSLSAHKKNAFVKECIWGEDSKNDCSGDIVKAHSIQRGAILKRISKNGMVTIFSASGNENGIFTNLDSEGIKKFSIFTGFCQKHDKNIFQPIEDNSYSNTLKQQYIYAYRSVAKEYHAKKESAHLTDNLLTESKGNKQRLEMKLFQTGLFLLEFKELCQFMKENIMDERFSGLKHYYYFFDKEYPIACNTCFIPYHGFDGNTIFTEDEKNYITMNSSKPKDNLNIFLNIFPENGKTHVIISHLKSHRQKYKFLHKLLKSDYKKISLQLSNAIVNYAENFALSPDYVEQKFSNKELEKVKSVFLASVVNTNNFVDLEFSLFR